MKFFKKRLPALITVCILLSSFCVCAASDDTQPDLPYYTVNDGERVAIPATYVYDYSINSIKTNSQENTFFVQPSDLFYAPDGCLYVADTDNNRVVKMTCEGELVKIFDDFGTTKLNGPEGVFVTENGTVYIADTANARIVEVSAQGELIKEFGLPESELLADVNVYSPSKLIVSDMGMIYVLMGENIMSITEDNEFIEYFGQSDIDFNFTEWLLRLVASDAQKSTIAKRNAASYTNLCFDESGLIYATSLDKVEGQIKVLNSVGNNTYRKIGIASGFWGAFSDKVNEFFSGNIMGKSFQYGEIYEKGKTASFGDICVNSDGIITVVEKHSCKLYQYDALGNLLCVFGANGTDKGEFTIPCAVVTDKDGKIYVCDSSTGSISVFKPTGFIKQVQAATVAYSSGDYKTAKKLWIKVLETDQTYPLAHLGIGNTLLKEGKYKQAMQSYKLSNDRKEYSAAFVKYRHEIISDNFGLVSICVIVIAVLIVVLIIAVFRKSNAVLTDFEYNRIEKIGFLNGIWISVGMCFRPSRTFEAFKGARGRIKMTAPVFILLLVFLTRIVFIYTVSYPLMDIERIDVNLLLEFIKLMLPVLTWIGMNYLISEQFSGEATLKETFISSAMCMTPYIIINLLAASFSHIMCWQEKGLFAVLVNGVVIWCIILLLKACRKMNDYSVGRTLFVALISVVAMVLLWFVCLFGYSLIMCLKEFFADIIQEIKLLD